MATMAADNLFVDTNIIVYASQRRAVKHQQALDLLRRADTEGVRLWISRQVLREYLAAVTRPRDGEPPLSVDTAIEDVQRFEEDFAIAEDGAHVLAALLDLLRRFPTGGRQIHDANIVATMRTYGIRRLLTFNTADFRRFSSVIEIVAPEAGS